MGYTKEQQAAYMKEWRKNPANKARQKKSQSEWYEKNRKIIYEKNQTLYWKLKSDIIEKLGGECKLCGTKDDLQFNHIDPAIKVTEASYRNVMAKDEEWRKCELLCKSCHRKYTAAENSLKEQHWLTLPLEERRRRTLDAL